MSARESVLDLIGGTPLVGLGRMNEGIAARVWLKLEFLNPGGSVKDRAAIEMVRAAQRSGALRPGGTIVEATSGNTGVGLAQAAAALGYHIVVVLPDKVAVEKMDVLRAYGAQVVLTPAALPREHPRHVARLAEEIARETPGGWLANQYDNPANPAAHVRTTGPEIWSDTGGAVTHLVAGIGTGGTISGTGRYLKEVSGGRVQVIGADPVTSAYSGGDGSPFLVEASGHYRHPDTLEDTWPLSFHQDVVDRIESLSDRESIRTVWRLAAEEGLLVGGSSGLVVAAALRVAAGLGPEHAVVAVLPDSGRNYLSTYHSLDWSRRLGFRDDDRPGLLGGSDLVGGLHVVTGHTTRAEALALAEGVAAAQPALPVVLAGRDPRLPTSIAEVLGDVTADELRAAVQDGASHTPVGSPSGPRPFSVGTGETAGEALARLDAAGVGHAYLVRDGRLAGVATREQLDHLAAGEHHLVGSRPPPTPTRSAP